MAQFAVHCIVLFFVFLDVNLSCFNNVIFYGNMFSCHIQHQHFSLLSVWSIMCNIVNAPGMFMASRLAWDLRIREIFKRAVGGWGVYIYIYIQKTFVYNVYLFEKNELNVSVIIVQPEPAGVYKFRGFVHLRTLPSRSNRAEFLGLGLKFGILPEKSGGLACMLGGHSIKCSDYHWDHC